MHKELLAPIANKPLHQAFLALLGKGHAPARKMIIEQFSHFVDPDGNFVEQFQSTGFEARLFELFLNTYFNSVGFLIDRSRTRPDFIIERNGVKIAIEATTANSSPKRPPLFPSLNDFLKLPEEARRQITETFTRELPFRLGSPLFSKLNNRYWELEQCKDKPFVIALESFHESTSSYYSFHHLAEYLYGLKHYPCRSKEEKFIITSEKIEIHQGSEKKIPSNFFEQPYTENISAIIFCNSGTLGKFNRMGYQQGYDIEGITLIRSGTCCDPNVGALNPSLFTYNLTETTYKESWGEGLVVLLNPHAKHPLPKHFFPDVSCYTYIENGKLTTESSSFFPYASNTVILVHP